MSAAHTCSFEDSKALFHYRCSDPEAGRVTHGTIPWSTVESAPHSAPLVEAVKAYAYRDLHPSLSTTSPDTSALQCDILGVAVSSIENATEARKVGIRRGFARSCAPAYNANEAGVRNDYTCHYSGGIIDDKGRRGSHPLRVTRGTSSRVTPGWASPTS